jgi:glycosyltransferase involved in cell wall biosynthesis
MNDSALERKHYLIICQYYYPDVTAAAFRIKETSDILLSRGNRVTVVTAKPHKAIVAFDEIIDDGGINVIRVPIMKMFNKGKWGYICHYISFLLFSIFGAIFKTDTKYDIVIASSPPLFVGLAGYVVSKIKKAKMVLDIRDIWPDTAVVAGQLTKDGIFYKYGVLMEKWLYRKSQLITCVAKPMAAHISKYVFNDKIAVIYNGVLSKYIDSESNILINKLNLSGKKVITYIGNFGYLQNLQIIMEAAKKFKEKDFDIFIKFIGNGVERDNLNRMIIEHNLDNVSIDGPVTKYEAMQIIRKSYALIIQLKDDLTMEKTIPSKVFDYMTAGKPILFGIKGEGKMILEQVKGNIYYQPDSAESFINAVRKLNKNYKQLTKYARENVFIVEQYYTREKMVDKLEKHLKEIIHS